MKKCLVFFLFCFFYIDTSFSACVTTSSGTVGDICELTGYSPNTGFLFTTVRCCNSNCDTNPTQPSGDYFDGLDLLTRYSGWNSGGASPLQCYKTSCITTGSGYVPPASNDGLCVCNTGYTLSSSSCIACSGGTWKGSVGNGVCSDCQKPTNIYTISYTAAPNGGQMPSTPSPVSPSSLTVTNITPATAETACRFDYGISNGGYFYKNASSSYERPNSGTVCGWSSSTIYQASCGIQLAACGAGKRLSSTPSCDNCNGSSGSSWYYCPDGSNSTPPVCPTGANGADANASQNIHCYKTYTVPTGCTGTGKAYYDSTNTCYKPIYTPQTGYHVGGTTCVPTCDGNAIAINYNINGGSSGSTSSNSCTYGGTYTLSTNGFIYPLMQFAGWATSPSGSVIPNTGDCSALAPSGSGPVTMYAQWAPAAINVPKGFKMKDNTGTLIIPANMQVIP